MDDDFGAFNIFERLPQDPERAFLMLERQFRRDLEEQIKDAHQEANLNVFFVDHRGSLENSLVLSPCAYRAKPK